MLPGVRFGEHLRSRLSDTVRAVPGQDPASQALENVTYTAYVNNIGPANGLDMHGCSGGLDPYGDTLTECGTGDEETMFTVDTDVLEEAREVRGNLTDYRSDVD